MRMSAAILGLVLGFGAPLAGAAERDDQRPAFVPAPLAGEQRLTGPELRTLLLSGQMECTDHRADDNSCSSIGSYAPTETAAIASGGTLLFSEAPRFEVAAWGLVHIRGDAVCIDWDSAKIRVLPNDDIDAARADEMSDQLIEAIMSEAKPTCSVYIREGDRLRERAFEEIAGGEGKEIDGHKRSYSRFFTSADPKPRLRAVEDEAAEHDS